MFKREGEAYIIKPYRAVLVEQVKPCICFLPVGRGAAHVKQSDPGRWSSLVFLFGRDL